MQPDAEHQQHHADLGQLGRQVLVGGDRRSRCASAPNMKDSTMPATMVAISGVACGIGRLLDLSGLRRSGRLANNGGSGAKLHGKLPAVPPLDRPGPAD
jgi:hypothetical protein